MAIAPSKVDTRWFQNQLADRRISQRQLAKLLGLDPGAVSLALRGKRKMNAQEVAEIARLLGVDASEVLVHLGADASEVLVHLGADGHAVRKRAPEGHGATEKASERVLGGGVGKGALNAIRPATGASGLRAGAGGRAAPSEDWQAEWMQKWMALGFALMKQRGV